MARDPMQTALSKMSIVRFFVYSFYLNLKICILCSTLINQLRVSIDSALFVIFV